MVRAIDNTWLKLDSFSPYLLPPPSPLRLCLEEHLWDKLGLQTLKQLLSQPLDSCTAAVTVLELSAEEGGVSGSLLFPVNIKAVHYRFWPCLHSPSLTTCTFISFCGITAARMQTSSLCHLSIIQKHSAHLWIIPWLDRAVLQVLCQQKGVRQDLKTQDFQKLWRAD